MAEPWVTKPDNANFFGWDEFVKYAMSEGIGPDPEDYKDWWSCWKMAYIVAMNR